jgi:hypothetical protein
MWTLDSVAHWVEVGLVVLIAMKTFGAFWQRREDVGNTNMGRLDGHDASLSSLRADVQGLREIRIANRLSMAESGLANLRTEIYKEFVLAKVCNERTSSAVREHNRDHKP